MNQKNETYNGWVNYETWAVSLCMENDYAIYRTIQDHMVDLVQEIVGDDHSDAALKQACEDVKEAFIVYYKEKVDQVIASDGIMDVKGEQLKKVVWSEIADNHFEEWIQYPQYLRDALTDERPSDLTLKVIMAWVYSWGNCVRVNHTQQEAKEKVIEIRGSSKDDTYYELAARVWQALADDPTGKHFQLPDQRKIQQYITYHAAWNKAYTPKSLYVRVLAPSRSSYSDMLIQFIIERDDNDEQ